VQYRVLFKSAEKVPWTALSQAPLSMNYEINRSEINYNVVNTLRVEFKDEYGASSFVEEQFVGSYYGLMFTDVNGMYYSTDLGVILKKLDFGTLGASQTTVSKEVKLTNKYKSDLKNIILSTTQMANNIYIELSEIESPFSPTTSLNLGTMLIGETRSFFVRVRTDKTSYGSGDFNITVVGDPLLI
jgi:hypothetical protein